MNIRVEVRSQAEFDACIAAGNIAVVIGCRVVAIGKVSVEAWENSFVEARENSSVVAWENSSVVARGNSFVVAWGNSFVVARGNSFVEAWGNSFVEARENSSVVAWENSSVVAWGNSFVEAWGNSSVVAWENSFVEAWGNSSVEARGNVLVRLFSALKIKASAYVAIYMHGKAKSIAGGKRLKVAPLPKSAKEWAEAHAVELKNGCAILYKALDDDFATDNARRMGLAYKVGAEVIAPDWDGGKEECGGGLHFSPRASMTLEFHSTAKRFVACRVALKDMRKPSETDHYPQKIKARACKVLAEVDRRGKAL